MSGKLLKEDDVIRAIHEQRGLFRSDKDAQRFAVAIEAIPPADRSQGEWIESFKMVEVNRGAYSSMKTMKPIHDGWSCSECSEHVEKRYPNCPYCLAMMKGADDE